MNKDDLFPEIGDFEDDDEEGDFDDDDEEGDIEMGDIDYDIANAVERLAAEAGDLSIKEIGDIIDEMGDFKLGKFFKKATKWLDPTMPFKAVAKKVKKARKKKKSKKAAKRRRNVMKNATLANAVNKLPGSVPFILVDKNGTINDPPVYGSTPLKQFSNALRMAALYPAAKLFRSTAAAIYPHVITVEPKNSAEIIQTPAFLLTIGGVPLNAPAAGAYEVKFTGSLINRNSFAPRSFSISVNDVTKPTKLLISAYEIKDSVPLLTMFQIQKDVTEVFLDGNAGVPITWTPKTNQFQCEVLSGSLNANFKLEAMQSFDRLANEITLLTR